MISKLKIAEKKVADTSDYFISIISNLQSDLEDILYYSGMPVNYNVEFYIDKKPIKQLTKYHELTGLGLRLISLYSISKVGGKNPNKLPVSKLYPQTSEKLVTYGFGLSGGDDAILLEVSVPVAIEDKFIKTIDTFASRNGLSRWY